MNPSSQPGVISQWTRIGVLFNTLESNCTPDIENLLIETARHIPTNPRLFTMAVTWLGQYRLLVARRRIAQMAAGIDDPVHSATLGLVLDTVRTMHHIDAFDAVISICHRHREAMPLFVADRANPALATFARDQSSRLGRRWKLWSDAVDLKPQAVRPIEWIIERNPSYQWRAVFAGSLRASILACLEYDLPMGSSEAQLARRCGVTRKAVHESLDHLEFCSLVDRNRQGRENLVTASSKRRTHSAGQPSRWRGRPRKGILLAGSALGPR